MTYCVYILVLLKTLRRDFKKGPCAPGLGLSECTSDTLLAVRLPNVSEVSAVGENVLPLVGEKDHVEFVILSGCW
jgi:hypothetical protein